MPRIILKGNQQQSIPVAGGAVRFIFDKLQANAVVNNLHAHITRMRILPSYAIVQVATTGPAVKGLDLAAGLSAVNFQRDEHDPATLQIAAVPGDVIQHDMFIACAGLNPIDAFPADIVANVTGGAVTTNAVGEVQIMFCHPQSEAPYAGALPLAAIANGTLNITVANFASTFGAGVSLSSASVIDIELEVIYLPTITMPPDLRWMVLNGQPTQLQNVNAFQFPAGRYNLLAYCPPDATQGRGGDAAEVARLTNLSGVNSTQGVQFPADKGALDHHSIWQRNGSQTALLTQLLSASVATVKTTIGGAPNSTRASCAVLKGTPPGHDQTKELFVANRPFTLDLTASGSAVNYHRFFVKRVFTPRKVEDAKVAAKAGIRGAFHAHAQVAGGRKIAAKDASLFARKLGAGNHVDPAIE